MFNFTKITIISLFALTLFFLNSHTLLAQNASGASQKKPAIDFTPQVNIPGVNITETDLTQGTAIGKYIAGLYNYATAIVGIIAAIILMYGGIIWITAGGNMERISNAKAWISAALSGLVLVMAAYTILYVVNPNLLEFKAISIPSVYPTETQNSGSGVTNTKDQLIAKYECSNILESEEACVQFCEKISFFLSAEPINVNGTTQYCCYCDESTTVDACCLYGEEKDISLQLYSNCAELEDVHINDLATKCLFYKIDTDEYSWKCSGNDTEGYYCKKW